MLEVNKNYSIVEFPLKSEKYCMLVQGSGDEVRRAATACEHSRGTAAEGQPSAGASPGRPVHSWSVPTSVITVYVVLHVRSCG